MVAFQSIFYCKRAKWQWIKSIWSEEMPLKGHQDHPMERVCRYRLVTAVAGPPVQLLTAMPDAELKLPERSINLSVAKRAGQE